MAALGCSRQLRAPLRWRWRAPVPALRCVGASFLSGGAHPQRRCVSTRSAAHERLQFARLPLALKTFRDIHGHFAVPLRFTAPIAIESPPRTDDSSAQRTLAKDCWPEELQGMKLGTTISRFLKACGNTKAPAKRKELELIKTQLASMGVPDVDDWKKYLWEEVTVAAMRTYRQVNGNLLVPPSFVVPCGDDTWPHATWGYKLGYWIIELRRSADKLLPYQLKDLSELQFSWNAREARWNRYYLPAMHRFNELHGHSQVPQSFVVPKDDPQWPSELGGYRLGQKVNNLRCGDPSGKGPTPDVEWQDVELIYKSWVLLEQLHGEADTTRGKHPPNSEKPSG